MKNFTLIIVALLLSHYNALAQDIIELDGNQSMCIAGKGSGQDGAINPYLGSNSIAIVENRGQNEFSVRIQDKDELVKIIPISPKARREIPLMKGQVLYFDSDLEATAAVSFRKMEE